MASFEKTVTQIRESLQALVLERDRWRAYALSLEKVLATHREGRHPSARAVREIVALQESLGVAQGQRTMSQVLRERANAMAGGCCNDFANMSGCDCLERAFDDLPGEK